MQRLQAFAVRVARGPVGGMLACLLLAAMLGGVALADPDALRAADRSAAPDAAGQASRESDGDGDGSQGAASLPNGVDLPASPAACHATADHLEGDLEQGDDLRGLERAIEVVLATCDGHADAPGLRRALTRLEGGLERFQARHEHGAEAREEARTRGPQQGQKQGRKQGQKQGRNEPGEGTQGLPGHVEVPQGSDPPSTEPPGGTSQGQPSQGPSTAGRGGGS